MPRVLKSIALVGALAALGACTDTGVPGAKTLAKEEAIDVLSLLAAHPGQKACTGYDAASNSCASLITSKVQGTTIIGREVAVTRGFDGKAQRIELVTRSQVKDGKSCVTAQGISLGKTTMAPEAAAFVLNFTKGAIDEAGGVCGTYFRAGSDYVVSTVGGNGRPFPPGDTALRFVTGTPALRPQ